MSGVQMVKAYALVPERKNSLKLQVRATNIRKENVAWGLWFNTRLPSNALVYVPVTNAADVQQRGMENASNVALVYTISDGVLSLDLTQPQREKFRAKASC